MDAQAVAALVVGTVVVLAIPALALSPQVSELIHNLRGKLFGKEEQARTH